MKKRLVLLGLVTVAAYGGSLRASWHLDDNHTIVENEKIDDLAGAAGRIVTHNRGWVDFTFTVNHILAGNDPLTYRAVNVAIHIASGVLVALLAVTLGPGGRRGRLAGTVAAGLFLLHPLATNSVTYVVQRYTSFATFFYLLSVFAYARGRAGDRRMIVLSWLAALGAARSKEIALTLPLVLLLVERLFPEGDGRRRFLRVAPHFLAVSLIPATLVAGRIGLGESLAEALSRGSRETPAIGRLSYLSTEIHVVTSYIRLLVLPAGLSIDHDVPVRAGPGDPATIGKALFLLLLAGAPFLLRRKNRLAAFGAGWFFVTLLVESSIIPIRDVMFEHRTYLPSVGFFLAVAALVPLPGRRRGAAAAAGAALLLLLGTLTAARNRVWRDDVALWSDAVRKAPEKGRPRANLGYAYLDAGERQKAAMALGAAIRLGPVFPEDLVTLAGVYHDLGREDEAEGALRRAIAARPAYGRPWRNLALMHLAEGKLADALAEASEAVRLDPDDAGGWFLLARIRVAQGDAKGAREAAERAGAQLLAAGAAALGDKPDEALRRIAAWERNGGGGRPDEVAWVGRALWEKGETDAALAVLAEGRRLFPEDASFSYYAGAIRLASGETGEAIPLLREAVRLAPADDSYRIMLARGLAAAGETAAARAELARLLSRPDGGSTEAKELLRTLDGKRDGGGKW